MSTNIERKNKSKLVIIILLVALIIVITAISFILVNKKLFYKNKLTVNEICEKSFTEISKLNPESASELGLPKKYTSISNERQLTDISLKAIKKQKQVCEYWLSELNKINYDEQTEKDKLNIDILKRIIDNSLTSANFSDYQYTVNQFCGVQLQTNVFMVNFHKIKSEDDANNYLIRLTKFKDKFNQTIVRLKSSKSKGIIPPKEVLEASISEMNDFISCNAKNNMLYTAFVQKLSPLKISSKVKMKLYNKAENEINNIVYPAYKKLIDYCNALKDKASNKLGLCNFKGGAKYYSELIHYYAKTNMTPDEVYNLGIRRISQIENEMKPLFKSLGIKEKTTGENLTKLCFELTDNSSQYPSTKAGMQQVLKDYQKIINDANKNVSNLFDIKPKTSVVVKEMSTLESENSAPHYSQSSADGSTPGIFFVPTYVPLKASMQDLAYHETIPGHHFQTAVQEEMKGVPSFRKFVDFPSFSEGWATYAERLAYENGFYKDPYSKLEFLQNELVAAVSLVEDVGINYKGWTRKKAISYGYAKLDYDISDQILRISAYPGQLVSYIVGESEILELRDKAKHELGSKFNIKKFHDAVLENGAVPLDILDKIKFKW